MKDDWLNKNVMSILALIVVVGGGVILSTEPDLKTEIVALVMLVLGFYFGSSPGSRKKDDALVELSKGGQPAPVPAPPPEPVSPVQPDIDPSITKDLERHDIPGSGPVG